MSGTTCPEPKSTTRSRPSGKRREDVLDELEKPVDLAELVVARLAYLSLGASSPRARRGTAPACPRGGRSASPDRDSSVTAGRLGVSTKDRGRAPTAEHLPVGVRRLQEALAKVGLEELDEAFGGRVRCEVLVRRAGRVVCREAVAERSRRPSTGVDGDPRRARRVAPAWPAERRAGERAVVDELPHEGSDVLRTRRSFGSGDRRRSADRSSRSDPVRQRVEPTVPARGAP